MQPLCENAADLSVRLSIEPAAREYERWRQMHPASAQQRNIDEAAATAIITGTATADTYARASLAALVLAGTALADRARETLAQTRYELLQLDDGHSLQ